MKAGGAVQGVSTIPRRGPLGVLLVIAVMVALVVWTSAFATNGGVGAEDAIPKAGAGSAIVHDDAGNTNRYSYPLPTGKVAGAVSDVLHDDAGNVRHY